MDVKCVGGGFRLVLLFFHAADLTLALLSLDKMTESLNCTLSACEDSYGKRGMCGALTGVREHEYDHTAAVVWQYICCSL